MNKWHRSLTIILIKTTKYMVHNRINNTGKFNCNLKSYIKSMKIKAAFRKFI